MKDEKEQTLKEKRNIGSSRKRIALLKERIEIADEKRSRLDLRKQKTERVLHETILKVLGASSEDYFSMRAEDIYKFAMDHDLDPRWFYDVIQRPTEYYLTSWAGGGKVEVNDPKTSDGYYKRAMQILGENKQGYGSHFSPIAYGLAKKDLVHAVELAQNEGDWRQIAYQWLLDNMGFLQSVYHKYFWDHY